MRERFDDHGSDEVTYRRGTDSATFPATITGQLLRVTDVQGVVKMVRTDADFIFAASNLVLNGSRVEPAKGDYIDVTQDGVTLRYQVLPPGNDEAASRSSGTHRRAFRVHTKLKTTV